MLRPYQQKASDAAIDWVRKNLTSCVIEAATGAGKSHIVADLADRIYAMSKKRVLCLAPSKELVEQNYEKFLLTGHPASIFSASAGRKETKNFVVFGSPQTVKNSLNRFKNYAAVIIDECHGITPTVQAIVASMKESNPKLRVIGLTATPYRMNKGYIFGHHYEWGALDEDKALNPYFDMCVDSIGARYLIDENFLTPPVFEDHALNYDTSGLKLNSTGNWDAATVDEAFTGKGRLTSEIVAEVVKLAQNRRGVMFFAATVRHANEILESLPKPISRIVTGATPKAEREAIIRAFKDRRLKYIVNVSCLTTGFDAPHVDVIAILRATESPGLLQQIIGRGLRLCDGKDDCLVMDYAGNIERHFPTDDVFQPDIRARKVKGGGEEMAVACPDCNHINMFTARENPDGFGLSEDGYFLDLIGQKLETPSHYGRRCTGLLKNLDRCAHYWEHKVCENCNHKNDIAARFCESCKEELIDPNEKLQIEAAKIAANPYAPKYAEILNFGMFKHLGRSSGKYTLRIDYILNDEKGTTISEWLSPDNGNFHKRTAQFFGYPCQNVEQAVALQNDSRRPLQICYRRNKGERYHKISAVEFENAL